MGVLRLRQPWEGLGYEEVPIHGMQIAFAPRQAETGTPLEEDCRTLGTSQATFFRRKKILWRPAGLTQPISYVSDAGGRQVLPHSTLESESPASLAFQ